MTEDLNPDDVREDPNLFLEEKQTSINFSKDEERATIHTDEASLIRRLLNHPEAEPNPENMNIRDGSIHSFYGTIPIGCLKIGVNSRNDNTRHSEVVSSGVYDSDVRGAPADD